MTDVRWHLKHEFHGSTPWAVQEEAMRRAAGRDRFGHWLECGLGKTPLTLNEFVDRDDVDCLVVICPQSFKQDWVLAAEEWGVGFIFPFTWHNGGFRGGPNALKNHFSELFVFNYEAVRWSKRGERGYQALEQLLRSRPCMLVIDESKAIGNPSSNTTKGLLQLVKYARVVRELNGTPMTESVCDYYGQLRALGELDGWNPVNFKNRFAVKGGYMGRQILRGEAGVKNAEELAAIIDGCTFRALKKDWRADLPPQITQTVHLEMTDNQLKHYGTMVEEFYAEIAEDEAITAELVLTQCDKLRQISSCLLLDGDRHYWIEPPGKNPKIKATLDLLDSGQGKTIVVYYYKQSGDALFEACRQAGLNPARIRGGVKPEETRAEKDRFNNDPSCRVIVGQEVAAARGHTLLGQTGKDRCNRTIFYENHFGLYWREQIKDRNHRGEQDETCWLIDFVTSPIEAVIVEGLVKKKGAAEMMDRVVEEVRKQKCRTP